MMINIKVYLILILYIIALYSFNLYVSLCIFYDNLFDNMKGNISINMYDYIIVGAGTAGSIIGFRLAQQNKNNKILVIESGGYGGPLFNIPSIGTLLHKTPYAWQYETVPQKYACKAMINATSFWPAGKIVGGSSKINNMVYVRGHRTDFDSWYQNDTNYNYENDIFYYLKKSEDQIGFYLNDTENHHTGGPCKVNDLSFYTPLANAVLSGAKEMNYYVGDINGLHQTGFTKPQVNLYNGKRYSTGDSLIKISKLKTNLHILTNAFVTKILLNKYNEAKAVKYLHFGKSHVVRAQKEIILTAGTIGTPKILMLSGIGPKEHLSELNIKVNSNLPVGQNLQDHITTGMDLIEINTTLPLSVGSILSPFSAWEYFYNGRGSWTSVGCEAIGLIHSKYKQDRTSSPDLELLVIPVGLSSDGGQHLKKLIGLTEKVWESYFKPDRQKNMISIVPVLLHPQSKGSVKLRNTDPFSYPVIDPNYLNFEEDINTLIEGIEFIKKLLKTESMQRLGAKMNRRTFPGCEQFEFNTFDYWKCYVKHMTLTNYHPVGTCKMGALTDSSAVVDYTFKVKNIRKLRVADASVMPSLSSGNINAVVMMIAEKAADMIVTEENENNLCSSKELFIRKRTCGN